MLVSPFLTYFLIIILKYFSIELDYILPVGNEGDWINFYATILSGLITVFILYYTLKDNKDQQEKKDIDNIRPFLITKIEDIDIKDNKIDIVVPENEYGFINWKILNVSKNPANKIKILEEYFLLLNDHSTYSRVTKDLFDEYNISMYTTVIQDYIFLEPGGESLRRTNVSFELNGDKYKFGSALRFKHCLKIGYSNINDTQEYYTISEQEIDINIDVNNKPIFFLNSYSNKIIQE